MKNKKFKLVTCPECEGQKYFMTGHNSAGSIPCSTCKGTGKISEESKKIFDKGNKKFECGCNFHIVDVDIRPIDKIPYIGMTIYEHRSGYTGKLFKKPKELGTVVLTGKEALKFKEFIEGVKGGK